MIRLENNKSNTFCVRDAGGTAYTMSISSSTVSINSIQLTDSSTANTYSLFTLILSGAPYASLTGACVNLQDGTYMYKIFENGAEIVNDIMYVSGSTYTNNYEYKETETNTVFTYNSNL